MSERRQEPSSHSKRVAVGRAGLHFMLLVLAGVTLVPFVWLLLASLKTPEDFAGSLFFPRNAEGAIDLGRFTFTNYERLFTEVGLGNALLNSVFLASAAAVLATVCCAAAGYALAHFRFKGRIPLSLVLIATVVIPPTLLLAPLYKLLFDLSLLDTYTGLLLPGLAPAFGIILFRQAMLQGVPTALLEAGRIDGCSEWGLFVDVAMPLVRPMVGAFMMITFLAMWNNFITPQIVLQSQEKYPLAVAVAQLRGLYQQEYGMMMAGTVVAVAPVAALFLWFQRDFIAGLTSGAVKG